MNLDYKDSKVTILLTLFCGRSTGIWEEWQDWIGQGTGLISENIRTFRNVMPIGDC